MVVQEVEWAEEEEGRAAKGEATEGTGGQREVRSARKAGQQRAEQLACSTAEKAAQQRTGPGPPDSLFAWRCGRLSSSWCGPHSTDDAIHLPRPARLPVRRLS